MRQREFPDKNWVTQISFFLPICLASFWALKGKCKHNGLQCLFKTKSGHGQPVWSLSGEAIVTADGVLFIIQVAEMAVQQYEYCVKVVNVTACYCLGTCTEQVSMLLKLFILWGCSAKVGRQGMYWNWVLLLLLVTWLELTSGNGAVRKG